MRAKPMNASRREFLQTSAIAGGGLIVGFTLPETAGGGHWQLLIDTNLPEDVEMSAFATGEIYGVTGRSLLLFALESVAVQSAAGR